MPERRNTQTWNTKLLKPTMQFWAHGLTLNREPQN